jgi:FemAB-related protein (PEP-CTERM system-associated)
MTSAPSLRTASHIAVRDDVPADACDAYVTRHPGASAYHRPLWLDVVRRAFGHETRMLVADSDRGIAGVLPLVFFRSPVFGRFAVSMPFFNYGGVLADSPEAEAALVERAIADTREAGGGHLELRHTRQRFPALTPRRHKVAMHLALAASPDAQWQALDRKLRNQVRKAEKSGLETVVGGRELLDDFYAVFCRNMRDLGTPVYSKAFFNEVLRGVATDGHVFVVRQDRQPIAASITHVYRGTMEVPWASAIRDFNPLCANVLLYWEMLKHATSAGLQTFDFGRSSPDAGTFHFKRQWGAVSQPLVWEYWNASPGEARDLSPSNSQFGLAIRVWQRLPVSVASLIGPHVVRNIP